MPYVLFDKYFPEVAKRETRTVIVFDEPSASLPCGDYSFLEMYCDEPGCDCRRVFFYVVSSVRKRCEAVIAWGWETREFYARWMHDDDPDTLEALKGPALNLTSPQSELAPAILELAKECLLSDELYVRRLKTHYAMFRARIDGPGKSPKRGRKNRGKRGRFA